MLARSTEGLRRFGFQAIENIGGLAPGKLGDVLEVRMSVEEPDGLGEGGDFGTAADEDLGVPEELEDEDR